MGTFYWNFVTGEADWSDQAYRVFGFGLERPKVTYELFLKSIHVDDRKQVNDLVEEAIATDSIFRCEFRSIGSDRTERWVLEYGKIFKDESGKPQYMLGTVQDITKRKLEQIEYERVVDESPAILWITGPDGRCSYLSKQWYEYTGQVYPEGHDFGWLNKVHPDDRPEAGRIFNEAFREHKPFYCEYRLETKSGEYRWALDTANPRFDKEGNYIGFAGTLLDIHEQKLANEKSKQIIETIPQGIWRTNPDGSADYFSESFSKLVGYSQEEFLGWGWAEAIHPDDRGRALRVWEEARNARASVTVDFRVRGKDGEYRWYLSMGNPFFDERGELTKYYGTWTDITDQRRQQEELEKTVRSRDEFLSIASHELKTPLTTLRLKSQLATKAFDKEPTDPKTIERLAGFAEQTVKQVDKLNRLVDDMLDVSRIQTGKLNTEVQEVDLSQTLSDLLERLEPQFQQNHYDSPVREFPSERVIIHGDQVRLEQVFTNLLSNAIRYGQGRLITVSLRQTENGITVSVKDLGLGIKPQDLHRIFDKFERAVEPNEVSGLGLGLYISQKIIEAHGGTIAVESAPQKGATFTVKLPKSV